MGVLSAYGTNLGHSNVEFSVDWKSGHGLIFVEVRVTFWVHLGLRSGTVMDLLLVVFRGASTISNFGSLEQAWTLSIMLFVSERSGDMC